MRRVLENLQLDSTAIVRTSGSVWSVILSSSGSGSKGFLYEEVVSILAEGKLQLQY